MHKKITTFLDEVCSHIKCKAVHSGIREELGEHIQDLMEENIENGHDEENALDRAISAMGSTGEIGMKLNRQHKTQTEWSLLILTALITVIGGIVLYSSSQFADGAAIDFSRYILFVFLGIGTMVLFYFLDYTKLERMPTVLYCCGLFLILITVTAGVQMNGLKRWLSFGVFTISVPELASLLFIVAFVGLLEKYRGKGAIGVIKLMAVCILSVLLLLMMPSTAAAFILAVTYAVLIITALVKNHFSQNKKSRLLLAFAGSFVSILLPAYYIMSNSYRLTRFITSFSGGKIDPMGVGYQQHMASTWLSLSNWLGKADETYQGLGLNMMPNVTGEYVLINVIATLGWAVGMTLIILIGIFIIRMFLTVSKVKYSYGFYLSLSSCVILSAQFVSNILMNFNFFPVTSIPMPFVSYGSTGYLVCMAYVGMILSVWRRNNIISYQKGVIEKPLQKNIFRLDDGMVIIDLKAWKNH